MLTKDCRAVLRKAGKETSGEITYDSLTVKLKWTPEKTRRVCDCLVSEGYANELRKQYVSSVGNSGAGLSRGIALTERGKRRNRITVHRVINAIIVGLVFPTLATILATVVLKLFS